MATKVASTFSRAAMALVAGLSLTPPRPRRNRPDRPRDRWRRLHRRRVGWERQLVFQGRSYPLSVGGASVGFTIGASAQKLAGTVENINRPEDIEGRYTQLAASASFGPGGKLIRLKNSKGVVLSLQGITAGFEASLAIRGLRISLK